MLLCNSICSSSLLNRFKYLRNKKAIWITGLYIWFTLLHLKQTPVFAYPWNFYSSEFLVSSDFRVSLYNPTMSKISATRLPPAIQVSVKLQILIFNHLLDISLWMSHGGLTPQKWTCAHTVPTHPPPNLFHLFGSLPQETVQSSTHLPKWTIYMSSLTPLYLSFH